jgi:hypothetical protein
LGLLLLCLANWLPVASVREESAQPQQGDGEEADTLLEAQAIDPEVAIVEIPALRSKAERLIRLLLDDPRDIEILREQLLKPGSSLSRILDPRKKSFGVSKALFGTQEYISPRVIHSVVKTHAYDPVLYEANLAVMTTFFYTAPQDADTMFEGLKALDGIFPEVSMPYPSYLPEI